jgi:hypothetical protein
MEFGTFDMNPSLQALQYFQHSNFYKEFAMKPTIRSSTPTAMFWKKTVSCTTI